MSKESVISLSSESSSESRNELILMLRKESEDHAGMGGGSSSPSHRINRTGTVKRTGGRFSLPNKNTCEETNQCVPDYFKKDSTTVGTGVNASGKRERYRRSLDSTYRRSLDSISEYKPKRCFSSCLVPSSSREFSSIDSSSSDYTDYTQHRSSTTTESTKDTTGTLSSSWFDNLSQDLLETPVLAATLDNNSYSDVEGEWNNFWSQYTNLSKKHFSCFSTCNEPKITNEKIASEKSTEDFHHAEKEREEKISFFKEEIKEALQCCRRLTEIFEIAVKRSEQQEETLEEINLNEEKCPFSVDPKMRQKIVKKPIYSSNNYLNLLFSSGMADILKKMLNKRRSFASDDRKTLTRSRSSCSE